jgi:hypothetical protein
MSKFCPNCGTQLDDSAAFCAMCGTAFVTYEQPVQQPYCAAPVEPAAPATGINADLFKKIVAAVLAGMVIFAVVLAIITFGAGYDVKMTVKAGGESQSATGALNELLEDDDYAILGVVCIAYGIANLVLAAIGALGVKNALTGKFDSLKISNPICVDDADYNALVKVLIEETAQYNVEGTAVVFMGHGTHHEANATYATLEDKLHEAGNTNYFIGTVEQKERFRYYAVVYGDLNGDTRIDGSDASYVQYYIANGKNTEADMDHYLFVAADANHDNVVDASDILAIQNHYTYADTNGDGKVDGQDKISQIEHREENVAA